MGNPVEIMREVEREANGVFRWSRRNVPHVVIPFKEGKASVCYFSSTDTLRLFWPYPSCTQSRKDFNTLNELLQHLKTERR